MPQFDFVTRQYILKLKPLILNPSFMRSTIPALMLCLFSLSSSAQSNCDSIKKENTYLRKALDLNTPIK